MERFLSRKRLIRLCGNFGVSFLGPLVGANALSVEFIETIYISLISSVIVTLLVLFRQMEKFEGRKKDSS